MTRRSRLLLAAALATVLVQAALPGRAASIINSKHDLSATSSGTQYRAAPTEITAGPCLFCHAPHSATVNTALWNRANPQGPYKPYTSSSAAGNMQQPDGTSLMCLSCHDGTIALGSVLSRGTIAMTSGFDKIASTSAGYIGTDLSDDHPVSISYATARAANPELAPAGSWASSAPNVKLDAGGKVQCTTCHDPHDPVNGKFLVMPNTQSALCTACHTKPLWTASSHATSAKTWSPASALYPYPRTGYSSVIGNGCENCHRPHAAAGASGPNSAKYWLLNALKEEDNCYACHDASTTPPTLNVKTEFTKTGSRHPVEATTGTDYHDFKEPTVISASKWHVECVDCHNPHADRPTPVGSLPGSLTAVRGVDLASGAPLSPATQEYQICFRCHGDTLGGIGPIVTRQLAQPNVRLQFQQSNYSYHPVGNVGRNTYVPSLLTPWTVSSTMRCGDCHNNDTGANVPGQSGPRGPHGSSYPALLERKYLTGSVSSNNPAADYALCFKCHSTTLINSTNQPFGGENGHLRHVGEKGYACSSCHAPHGVFGGQANRNSSLINFDTTIVTPVTINNVPTLYWQQTTPASAGSPRGHGTCYLRCHGTTHNPESY